MIPGVTPFLGPSYNLESREASVQRTINMVPVPLEPGNERTAWVFEDAPGLAKFVDSWGVVVPPAPDYSIVWRVSGEDPTGSVPEPVTYSFVAEVSQVGVMQFCILELPLSSVYPPAPGLPVVEFRASGVATQQGAPLLQVDRYRYGNSVYGFTSFRVVGQSTTPTATPHPTLGFFAYIPLEYFYEYPCDIFIHAFVDGVRAANTLRVSCQPQAGDQVLYTFYSIPTGLETYRVGWGSASTPANVVGLLSDTFGAVVGDLPYADAFIQILEIEPGNNGPQTIYHAVSTRTLALSAALPVNYLRPSTPSGGFLSDQRIRHGSEIDLPFSAPSHRNQQQLEYFDQDTFQGFSGRMVTDIRTSVNGVVCEQRIRVVHTPVGYDPFTSGRKLCRADYFVSIAEPSPYTLVWNRNSGLTSSVFLSNGGLSGQIYGSPGANFSILELPEYLGGPVPTDDAIVFSIDCRPDAHYDAMGVESDPTYYGMFQDPAQNGGEPFLNRFGPVFTDNHPNRVFTLFNLSSYALTVPCTAVITATVNGIKTNNALLMGMAPESGGIRVTYEKIVGSEGL